MLSLFWGFFPLKKSLGWKTAVVKTGDFDNGTASKLTTGFSKCAPHQRWSKRRVLTTERDHFMLVRESTIERRSITGLDGRCTERRRRGRQLRSDAPHMRGEDPDSLVKRQLFLQRLWGVLDQAVQVCCSSSRQPGAIEEAKFADDASRCVKAPFSKRRPKPRADNIVPKRVFVIGATTKNTREKGLCAHAI